MFWLQSLIRPTQRKVSHLCKLCNISYSSWNPSKNLPIIHHEDYVCDLPPNHRFPMPKFSKIYECLLKDGVIGKEQVSRPSQVSVRTTERAHTKEYVANFFSGRTSEKEQRATGFKWSSGLVKRCRYETGGTVLASQIALSRGLAASTAGGTHHAFPGHGAGFCLINDMAVAARHLIEMKKVEKVLFVDLDVHQGDGSADIFKDDSSVFTFSVHCGKNYPSRKQESDLDVSIEAGMEDEEYLSVVKEHLPWIVNSFRPDLVIYDAGVDPHVKDDLGKLKLTDKGLFDRDFWVIDFLVRHGCPCATVIGGGYSKNIDELAVRHSIVHRAAKKVWISQGL
ncbi:Histone deacetylase 11 [Holothuria leucospilota]|uniref:Histone deacetylase 11 n=1 Tax=Holothuria leucospilota TaxID=206669 RepID=A0A9Q1GZD5_HOLLE|nr:Histone deacetylase 11 [Holothuria leucospilota]